jgi:hypothetical protein
MWIKVIMRTTITVGESIKKNLEELKGGIGWEEFLKGVVDSIKSLKEKHSAVDRKLSELNESLKRLEELRKDGVRRIEEAEKNIDSNILRERDELRKEVNILRELNKLRKGD